MHISPIASDLIIAALTYQAAPKRLFQSLDFDNLAPTHLMLAAHIAEQTRWQEVPDGVKERLETYLDSAKQESANAMSALTTVLPPLAQAHIPVMLLKDTALRAHYLPHIPRANPTVTIATPPELFAKALCELQTAGVTHLDTKTPQKEAFETPSGVVLIQRFTLASHTDAHQTDLWKVSIPVTLGVFDNLLVPAPADLICQLSIEMARHEFEALSQAKSEIMAFDILALMRTYPQATPMNLIAERAKALQATHAVRYVFETLATDLPLFIDLDIVNQALPKPKHYERWLEAGHAQADACARWREIGYAHQTIKDALPRHAAAWRRRAIEHGGHYSPLRYAKEENPTTREDGLLGAILEKI